MAVFAGKIDYPIYTFWDQPDHQANHVDDWRTDRSQVNVVDFTDWNKVDDFGRFNRGDVTRYG